MGLIKTISNFCYIECDLPNCNRKMEHIDESILKQLADLCNWENRDGQWLCPECLNKASLKAKGPAKSKKSKKKVSQKPS